MLTVKSEIQDKQEAFNLGADDYLTKPFLLEELLIRIKALLRRPQKIETLITRIGDLTFNLGAKCFKRGGQEIYLTRREYCLLEYLVQRRDEVVSRGEILENVWDYNADPFSNSIETHITSLRKKLNIGNKQELIHTFSGRGYKLALKKRN
jgi:DNA-binding response OmpR family regulator